MDNDSGGLHDVLIGDVRPGVSVSAYPYPHRRLVCKTMPRDSWYVIPSLLCLALGLGWLLFVTFAE